MLTDHVSNLLFAPTDKAVENLKRENITENVMNVGDVMYDAFLYNSTLAEKKYSLGSFGLVSKEYLLATIHRAENTDSKENLEAIFEAFSKLEDTVFLPLHPRTKYKLEEYSLTEIVQKADNIKIVEPVSYLEMLLLEKHAKVIVTDSGGVQKEAYFAKVPCFTLRSETEWVETVEVGCNRLVNLVEEDLATVIQQFQPTDFSTPLYGDGKASERIAKTIVNFLSEKAAYRLQVATILRSDTHV